MNKRLRSFEELLNEYLEDPEFALCFLNQALAEEDFEVFKLSLKDIIRARGDITQLAKKAQLNRGTLYKLMSGQGATEMETLLKLLHALGYDLMVIKKAQSSTREMSVQPAAYKKAKGSKKVKPVKTHAR